MKKSSKKLTKPKIFNKKSKRIFRKNPCNCLKNPNIDREYKINIIQYIKFYDILFDIEDGVVRMRLYRKALSGLNIKDSAITQHLLVTKDQLLNAIKFNLIHPDERFLRNKILKLPDNILYDVGIPNDGWGKN